MKTYIAGLALGAIYIGVFADNVLAQNVPPQFVVSGKAAEQIQDFTTINLATAEKLTQTCETAATAANVQVSIYVLDNDGNYVYMDRMDGQGHQNIITAEQKARTALMGREPSKVRMNRVQQNPTTELQQIQLGFYANGGGLPIVANKQLIGVIGVGGSQARPPVRSDEICGHKALTEVIGPSVAPLGPDLPPQPRANAGKPATPLPKFTPTASPKITLPPEWGVGGKAAAKKVAKACRNWATAHNGTMSLFILDNAGEFVHAERMDGQIYNNIRTALLKAHTALRLREPTSIREIQLKNNPAGLPRSIDWFDIYGVGGGAGGGDENCAIAGLKATFGDRVAVPVYPSAANKDAQPG